MKQLRYPLRALVGDYLRSGAGLFVGLGVLAAVTPTPTILAIFGSLAALFAVFGLRTAHRHHLKVMVTEQEIACRGATTKTIPWQQIEAMKLRYFGARPSKFRPRASGFMQLTLKGAGKAMTFESSIEGFDWLAGRAAAAMRDKGLAIDPATASYLIDLGVDPGGGGEDSSDGCDSAANVL